MIASEDPAAGGEKTTSVERASDRELVVRRIFDASPELVFDAWSKPELMRRWWAPQSFCVAFVSCEMDCRTGGSYRFVMSHPSSDQPMAFFGRYLEVARPTKIVWTNEEDPENGSVTTVTFDDRDGRTLVTVHDLYPSKAALDAAVASGATSGFDEQFRQLDAHLLA